MGSEGDERWRELERESSEFEKETSDEETVQRAFLAAGVLLLVVLTFWLAVQIASLFGGHWLPLGESIGQAAPALVKLLQTPGEPALAYEPPLRDQIASAPVLYLILLILVGVEAYAGLRTWRWWKARSRPDKGETDWAGDSQLETLVRKGRPGKIARKGARTSVRDGVRAEVILGLTGKGRPIQLEPESHALVVAGTRSGKTAGLCIPALLTFPGTVIATSIKNDLLQRTLHVRQSMGEVYVFDPVEATGLARERLAGWTPLQSSKSWQGAQRTASALIEASTSRRAVGSENSEFFKRMGEQTLPVLLYAAAVMDEPMWRVTSWLHRIKDKQTLAQIAAILQWAKNRRAWDAWQGFITKEPKIRGDIAATMAAALVSYEDEKVERNSRRCDITPEDFFNGQANTLYVCAPMAEQSRLQPVFVALIQNLLLWVTAQPEPLETPLLVVLDEAANIAALPLLPELLSTIGGQNVQIITSWQDFSQISARYGEQKNTILNNSRGKLVLPGVGDPETIRYFADVTGETRERQVSISRHGDDQRNVSLSEGRRSLLTPATIREQKVGEAILVYGHLPPAKIRLRLWFQDRQLKQLVEGKKGPARAGLRAASRVQRD